jgi:hypothetical protein
LRLELSQLGKALAIRLLCNPIVIVAPESVGLARGCFANASEKIRCGLGGLLFAVNHHFSSRGCGAGRSVILSIACPTMLRRLRALAVVERDLRDVPPEALDDQVQYQLAAGSLPRAAA